MHEATDFAKSHFKKEKISHVVRPSLFPVAFSFWNEFRFVFTWVRRQISIWIEISFRNEIRIELDPDRVVTRAVI
jgi:hypothetical protein